LHIGSKPGRDRRIGRSGVIEKVRRTTVAEIGRAVRSGSVEEVYCTAIGIARAAEISARKKSIIGILSNVAELGAGRMEETIGKAGLRDAAIGTGIAVDKMLALMGQMPTVQIANLVMPTEAEREQRDLVHARLDEIARGLRESSGTSE